MTPKRKTDFTADDRDLFLRVQYADAKDAFKQLFTLIAGVVAVTAAFGDKSGAFAAPEWGWRLYYFSPYLFFVVALALCCAGYYVLMIAGEIATGLRLWGYLFSSYEDKTCPEVMVRSSRYLEFAGITFVFGLLMLGIVTVFRHTPAELVPAQAARSAAEPGAAPDRGGTK